jgi:hypothetical protein
MKKDYKETVMLALAVLGVLAPLAIIAVLLIKQSEPSALVAGFIGVIVGSYTTIFSYYFGSSSGSKSKQETLDKIASEPEQSTG